MRKQKEISCVVCGQPTGFAATGDHLINRVPWQERVVIDAITIIDGTSPLFLGLLVCWEGKNESCLVNKV